MLDSRSSLPEVATISDEVVRAAPLLQRPRIYDPVKIVEARAAGITVARARELGLWFVALLVRPGCLTHLIVLRFGDAFLEHLRTFAPSLGIFIFSEGVCCLPSG